MGVCIGGAVAYNRESIMTESLCDQCPGMCCRYIALPIDKPDDRESFEEIRWFLMHEGVTVFVTDGQWYVSVATRCKHLDEQGMCDAYATRPAICRNYSSDNCDYHGGEYEYQLFFTHAGQLADYAAEQLGDAWTAPAT